MMKQKQKTEKAAMESTELTLNTVTWLTHVKEISRKFVTTMTKYQKSLTLKNDLSPLANTGMITNTMRRMWKTNLIS